ncbi:MAG: 4-carboxymuconolactone decarboxylase [Micrococcales bacterium 73-13]|nr:MAG: 4-carboxymuconolactone decarboxylase [Micrococcales bacterium 73-13]
MSEAEEPSPIQRLLGDFAPKFADLTDEVLFGDVWRRPELSPRDRSLITITSLVSTGSIAQLEMHIPFALANGVTEEEIKEAIVHVAFYAGWPPALSALTLAKRILAS